MALKPVVDAQLKEGFGPAEEWTKVLASEKLKEAGCRMLAESLMKTDPDKAVTWVEGFSSESYAKDLAIRRFSLEASPKDPESAAVWAATISDSQLRQRTLVPVARQWLLRDRAATLEWLATLDLPQETLNSILGIKD